jgi:hypothetical protein
MHELSDHFKLIKYLADFNKILNLILYLRIIYAPENTFMCMVAALVNILVPSTICPF